MPPYDVKAQYPFSRHRDAAFVFLFLICNNSPRQKQRPRVFITEGSQDVISPEIDGYKPDKTVIPQYVPDLADPKDGEDEIVVFSPEAKTFTVTFMDGFGKELKVEHDIPEHGSAKAPEDPARDGPCAGVCR